MLFVVLYRRYSEDADLELFRLVVDGEVGEEVVIDQVCETQRDVFCACACVCVSVCVHVHVHARVRVCVMCMLKTTHKLFQNGIRSVMTYAKYVYPVLNMSAVFVVGTCPILSVFSVLLAGRCSFLILSGVCRGGKYVILIVSGAIHSRTYPFLIAFGVCCAGSSTRGFAGSVAASGQGKVLRFWHLDFRQTQLLDETQIVFTQSYVSSI